MNKISILCGMAIMLLPVVGMAEKRVYLEHGYGVHGRMIRPDVANADCPLKETSSMSFNINRQGVDGSGEKLMELVKQYRQGVETIAKETGITRIEVTSMSYNFSGNMSGGSSQPIAADRTKGELLQNGSLNLSMSINFEPAAKAMDFLTALVAKRYPANLNYSAYRDTCGDTSVKMLKE